MLLRNKNARLCVVAQLKTLFGRLCLLDMTVFAYEARSLTSL